ncbi:MAG TPA: TolC family protein [Terriglobales bacterium]
MKFSHVFTCCLMMLLLTNYGSAQNHESYSGFLTTQVASDKLPGPLHLRDYIADGKLRLSLHDAVVLTLENNSGVRIDETQVEGNKFQILRAHNPFDPQLQASLDANRYSSSGTNQLQGIGNSVNATLNALTQVGQVQYNQFFPTGTQIQAKLNTTKSSTNNGFFFLNPNYSSTLNLQVSQSLLRNRGFFPNLAPLMISRRILQQSQASFEAQVNDAILMAVTQYWGVVQAQGNLDVERKSLEAADESYQHDKRALALGALPPLDIYRSESEVASRRVQMIQAEYTLKQAENNFRGTIGAMQDPYFSAIDLDLTEKPDPQGDLRDVDVATALHQAQSKRPEFLVARYALQNDDTNIRVAHNDLRPDLSIGAFYQSSGLSGNQFDLTTGQLISSGGIQSSYGQLFGFSFPGYGATLTLNLPIRKHSAQAELGTALVSRHHDLYAQQQIQEVVALDVSNSVHQLEEAKLTLAAGNTALDLAQKALTAEQRKYELGAETIFFVLDAQTRLETAQLNLLQAQVSYQVAVAAVDHATGGLLQPYQVQIADLTH